MEESQINTLSSTRRVNILFILHNLVPAGVPNHVLNVLKNLDYRIFNPYVCCIKKYGKFIKPIEDMGIEVIDLSVKSIYSIRSLLGLMKLYLYIRKRRIQIVHNFLLKSIVLGTLGARLAGCPVVINGRRDMGWALDRKQIFLLNFSNYYSDRVICVCNAVKEAVLEKEKVAMNKIVVVHNGIDIDKFSPNRFSRNNCVRSEFGIASEDPLVGTITHLTKWKGNEYLVQAAPSILEEFPNTKFLIVGDGPLRKELEDLCNEKGVRRHFVFSGERLDIPEVLSAIDIYVCPSITEGHSNSILEAMATGKVVIATDVGGNKELIENGRNGILVKPMNTYDLATNISKLLGNHEVAARMGNVGRELVVQKHAVENITNRLMQEYISILRNKGAITVSHKFCPR